MSRDKLEVRAIGLGYYGGKLRQKCDEFTLSDPDHFSSSWMVRINLTVTCDQSVIIENPQQEISDIRERLRLAGTMLTRDTCNE